MYKKYVRFQEIMKDENNKDIVVTVASLQKISDSGDGLESGPSFSIESENLETYTEEKVEIVLSSQQFDELRTLYNSNQMAFLMYRNGIVNWLEKNRSIPI